VNAAVSQKFRELSYTARAYVDYVYATRKALETHGYAEEIDEVNLHDLLNEMIITLEAIEETEG
jgi:hypothetical protein